MRLVTNTDSIADWFGDKEAVKLIQNKATSFRQIVQIIDAFEKVAQANSLNVIDENVAGEILNG